MLRTIFKNNFKLSLLNSVIQQFSTLHKPSRFSHLSQLTNQDIQYFQKILQPNEIVQDPTELSKYKDDFTKAYKNQSQLALKPKTLEKLTQILKYCNDKKIAVVPQGGNTGLVGGSVPVYDEIIVSLENFNKIINFDQQTQILTCEGGCILEEVNNYLDQFQSEIPWDLGAKGSCHIGGNIATAAGGQYMVRYGPIRGNVTGLEIVLPSGQLLDLKSTLIKDNTGFDLKSLFVGSEGTLGLITKCNIVCVKKPKHKNILFLQCSTYDDVLKINKIAKNTLRQNLFALEFQDGYTFNAVMQTKEYNGVNPFKQQKIGDDPKLFYVLIEVGSNFPNQPLIDMLYENLDQEKCFKDVIMPENEAQTQKSSALAVQEMGQAIKYDISLNVRQFEEICNMARTQIQNKSSVKAYAAGYGHLGDGNLHLDIVCPNVDDKNSLLTFINDSIYEYLYKNKGSINAEHGIGQLKTSYLHYSKDQVSIDYMKQIKKIFDPNNILNPYKVLV